MPWWGRRLKAAAPDPSTSAAAEPLLRNAESAPDVETAGGAVEPKGAQRQTWVSIVPRVFRYMWPSSLALQLKLAGCFLTIGANRVAVIAIPLIYARLINDLSDISHITSGPDGHPVDFRTVLMPWALLWLCLYALQGGAGPGVTSQLFNVLWRPVQQNAFSRVNMLIFDHIMDLDLNFHVMRKTGELIRIINRGTSSIQVITNTLLFTVGPQVIDIIGATVVVWVSLSGWISAVVFLTSAVYIPMTVLLAELKMKQRRYVNELDNAKSGKIADALLNYETVKYFTNEKKESDSYRAATEALLTMNFQWMITQTYINLAQRAVLSTGLVAGTLLCLRGVGRGEMVVGDVVLFITMLNQLAGPLNSFGGSYRTVQKSLVDMENIFEILDQEPRVQDEPDAGELTVREGEIELKGVSFAYSPDAPILKNISLTIPAGKTVALVGETGSGKSTLLRLLFRFYDPTGGEVCIDGVNIKSVTQRSLRSAIGVVPQDTVLFNGSIAENIAYGGPPDASLEDVQRAAREAQIHDHIINRFPQGYETAVGERGVRLSGGEKQRIAIARTLMKDPPLLILDEATSALDTITEKAIQAELENISSSRTTVIVAHRLSTIMRADKIVVMHHGELAEEGTHAELMALGGRFASLWSKQQEAAEDSGMQRSSSLAHVRELESCKLFAAMRGAQESTDGDNDDLAILNRSNTI